MVTQTKISFRKSIGFRLLIISLILLAFPLLIDSFILVQKNFKDAIINAKDYLVETVHLKELPLSEIQPIDRSMMVILSHFLKLSTDFPAKDTPELTEKLKKIVSVGDFYSAFLLKKNEDDRFVVLSSSDPTLIGRDYTDLFSLNEPFSPAALERGYTDYIVWDKKNLDPFFIVIHLVNDMKGEPQGILAIADNIRSELSLLMVPDKKRYPVNFALLLPSSIVFAASDPDLNLNYFEPIDKAYREIFVQEAPFFKNRLAEAPLPTDNQIGYPFFEFKWKGKLQVGYIEKFPRTNFSILAYASHEEIYQQPIYNFLNIYGVYGLILLIGGTLAYFLTRRMTQPIRNLSKVMAGIQEGQLTARYEPDFLGFEINTLGAVFNETVDAILDQKGQAAEERVNREILAKELRLGQQVQRSLLPQEMPHYHGVEIGEVYIPAIEVGGDFYDVFIREWEDRDQLVIAVADGSGKGVQACFFSLTVRNLLRILAKQYVDIAQIMKAVNELFLLYTGETCMFVTAITAIYDYRTQRLSYYSCGHNPGIIKRATGEIVMLDLHGMAMGVMPFGEIHSVEVQLYPGDVVIFYSDGITEAHNMTRDLYGEERLKTSAQKSGSAQEIAQRIIHDVTQFVGAASQHDDITLLVMKVK